MKQQTWRSIYLRIGMALFLRASLSSTRDFNAWMDLLDLYQTCSATAYRRCHHCFEQEAANDGPKQTKILVTNLPEVTARQVVDAYRRRWSVEVTIKELKSGLHLGEMQVTKEAERVRRSVALSVVAYRLLVRLYGCDAALSQEWSLFKLKEHFAEEVAQDAVTRTELKWQRKLKQYQHVA
jgi:Transposase DDE domain